MSIIHSKELKIELLVGLQEHLNIFMGGKTPEISGEENLKTISVKM